MSSRLYSRPDIPQTTSFDAFVAVGPRTFSLGPLTALPPSQSPCTPLTFPLRGKTLIPAFSFGLDLTRRMNQSATENFK